MDQNQNQPKESRTEYYQFLKDIKLAKKYTPDQLLDKAEQYMIWLKDNPLIEEKPFGSGYVHHMKHPRPPTLDGFFVFSGLSKTTFWDYTQNSDYENVINNIRSMFFAEKIEGAATSFWEPNLIARELGLRDTEQAPPSNISIQIQLPGKEQLTIDTSAQDVTKQKVLK